MRSGLLAGVLVGCGPFTLSDARDTSAPARDSAGDSGGEATVDTGADTADTSDSAEETGLPNCDQSKPWIDVTAGVSVTCGVHADGCAECWGAPSYDPRHDDTGTMWGTAGFVKHVPDGPWTHIEVARYFEDWANIFACGVRPGGDVECWDGGDLYTWAGPWTSVSLVAGLMACAIDVDGVVVCSNSSFPLPEAPPPDRALFEAVDYGELALGVDGDLWTRTDFEDAREYTAGDGPPYADAAGDGDVWCAVDLLGSLSCAETLFDDRLEIQQPPEGEFVDVCLLQSFNTHEDTACARRLDGTAVCWGKNPYEAPAEERFDQISCGDTHACGLTTDQRIVCWGECTYGECDPPK